MLRQLFDLAPRALALLPPEQAHEVTLRSLELGVYPAAADADPAQSVQFCGLALPNPIGIAAGFDKDARVPDAILGLGCGFAEIGTVTPLPQPGNPTPRVFRLKRDHAVINRLGFNNGGHAAALRRLQQRTQTGVVGVNIGANKDATDRVDDYVRGLDTFYGVASYFTINISSPNTPGLRDLQDPAALEALLGRLMTARAKHVDAGKPRRPIVVKLAPDIDEQMLPQVIAPLAAASVDGIAVSNTTLSRKGLSDPSARETGGLSGRPLFHRSTVMLARVYEATSGKIPLIGIGGIDSGASALAKIEAGATLVQLYTGLVYEGPGLIARIKEELATGMRRAGARSLSDLVGRRSAQWAAQSID
ncbi:quinone-dependent dihydroorotate dehydrogenase [Hyphomicrobium sp. xq]|uniref:Dihydroorotate dehydrogenase (quinone) n=1 Tax=Hyphomicrobium album TaxID=2665159 RepID=A0A6I3KS91_9HYPH|nr:quinone-dependent dihydroorotate dehydrogenase [Hyphomicrobium album]MTD95611.1 quinone-dependent dihydroorotate dehydrogenase [Hyphomicrobium album]